MNQQQPEAPQSSRERDALRRWPFAHSIYQLIQSAPKEWSLRIGIFGRWGEGEDNGSQLHRGNGHKG